jgi:hypothetical protein
MPLTLDFLLMEIMYGFQIEMFLWFIHIVQFFYDETLLAAFSAHILFDDAFEKDDDEESVPNSFVRLYASLMNEAAR